MPLYIGDILQQIEDTTVNNQLDASEKEKHRRHIIDQALQNIDIDADNIHETMSDLIIDLALIKELLDTLITGNTKVVTYNGEEYDIRRVGLLPEEKKYFYMHYLTLCRERTRLLREHRLLGQAGETDVTEAEKPVLNQTKDAYAQVDEYIQERNEYLKRLEQLAPKVASIGPNPTSGEINIARDFEYGFLLHTTYSKFLYQGFSEPGQGGLEMQYIPRNWVPEPTEGFNPLYGLPDIDTLADNTNPLDDMVINPQLYSLGNIVDQGGPASFYAANPHYHFTEELTSGLFSSRNDIETFSGGGGYVHINPGSGPNHYSGTELFAYNTDTNTNFASVEEAIAHMKQKYIDFVGAKYFAQGTLDIYNALGQKVGDIKNFDRKILVNGKFSGTIDLYDQGVKEGMFFIRLPNPLTGKLDAHKIVVINEG